MIILGFFMTCYHIKQIKKRRIRISRTISYSGLYLNESGINYNIYIVIVFRYCWLSSRVFCISCIRISPAYQLYCSSDWICLINAIFRSQRYITVSVSCIYILMMTRFQLKSSSRNISMIGDSGSTTIAISITSDRNSFEDILIFSQTIFVIDNVSTVKPKQKKGQVNTVQWFCFFQTNNGGSVCCEIVSRIWKWRPLHHPVHNNKLLRWLGQFL